MNRLILTTALLGLGLAVTAPAASAAGISAAGGLKAAADELSTTEGATPVHYRRYGYGGYYRPRYGYSRPYYGYGYNYGYARPYYYGYGYARPRYYGYRYRW